MHTTAEVREYIMHTTLVVLASSKYNIMYSTSSMCVLPRTKLSHYGFERMPIHSPTMIS